MLLAELVRTSLSVGETTRRTEKTARLAECIRRLAPLERGTGVSYLAGELPQGRVGIGYALLQATQQMGAASEPSLTILDVAQHVDTLQGIRGAGSGARRERELGALFARATPAEQDFLRGLLLGEIRQGALESLVLDALAAATGVAASTVRRARMFAPGLAAVGEAAFQGEAALAAYAIQLFHPILPMLAHPAEGLEDALERLGTASIELKLDGARVQVHRRGDDVRIFSREMRDVTASLPEVVTAVRALHGNEAILDGEVLAMRQDGGPHAFQTTMRRFGRKQDDAALRRELPVRAFFFDCLLLDGRSLVDLPTSDRWEALTHAAEESLRIPRMVTASAAEAQAFLDDALARGHEGVMAKALDGPYEAGRRGQQWLKIKKAHTLDLVVLAVEWGSGRRAGTLSNIHLGARDPQSGGFVMLGKTFKGMTDQMLRWQTERFLALQTAREGHVVHVRPEQVVEVAFSDVQVSPHYPGGVALRLARVKRYRPDKSADCADTIETVRALVPRS